jgi:hypothetical protein
MWMLCQVLLIDMDVKVIVNLWHGFSEGNASYHEELCNSCDEFKHKMLSGNPVSYIFIPQFKL